MIKKALISFILTILFVSLTMSSFAMNTMVDGARNIVGGAENMIKNAGNNRSNGVKNGLNTVTHGTENVVTDVKDGMQNTGNSMAGMMTSSNNNDGYTAQRTATNGVTVAGMSTNTWSWLIIGITAAAIIILVWSYLKQKNSNDLYIDSDEL